MQKLIGLVRRCVQDYHMIEEGDRIGVGVSGGKDSVALLAFLAELRKYNDKAFDVEAVTIDMGLGMDYSSIAEYCEKLDVKFNLVHTEIGPIIFDHRKEKNPCSMCAKMRRGALYRGAKEVGCTSVALGYHFDDVVETFMLNLFYEGRIGCFQPSDGSRSSPRSLTR